MVANIKLHTGAQADEFVNATLDVRRDGLSPLFDWSLTAQGTKGSVKLSNVGFPFVWHALDIEGDRHNQHRREERYGKGDTTFEYQLAAFVAAVRGSDASHTSELDTSIATMRLVDDIWTAAGNVPLP